MSRYLMVDIGAGTMDVLYYDDGSGLHYKAVARSPVLSLAERAADLRGNLLITGCEMGGGSLAQLLRQRVNQAEVIMSRSAAFTIHHDLEKVKSWGIRVVEDAEAAAIKEHPRFTTLVLADLETDRLRQIVEGLGVPFAFDAVAVCAQDHGMAPPGISHLDYRHNIFRTQLDQNPYPHALLYQDHMVPETFNRLKSIAASAQNLPTKEIFVMDSGMAAILGASLDYQAGRKTKILVLDVATSHTVGAALEHGELTGMFEYHTQDISLERLEALLYDLAEGRLDHARILAEGGHGAYMRKTLGFAQVESIVATGPKRRMLEGSRLPITLGAPWGDNMMTGTVGLLEAVRRHKRLPTLTYL
jgi:uncharacterized protein (DUF1786 family)